MQRTALVVALLLTAPTLALAEGELNVFFLNVGHGDAILVDLDHWEILIDTGTKQYWDESSYCTQLLDKYVSKPIEVFVLSHPDADHYNGFEFISNRYGVVSIWHGPDPADDHAGGEFLNDIVPAFCERTISWSEEAAPIMTGQLAWKALHPLPNADGDDDTESLVLEMTFGNAIYIFAGDIHRSAQSAIIQRFPEGVADPGQDVVLKLPHHGSNPHVDGGFYEWSRADYAVCSSDEDCAYALQTCADLGILAYSTVGYTMIWVHQNGPNGQPAVEPIE